MVTNTNCRDLAVCEELFMKCALKLLTGGLPYIGRSTAPRFEPLTMTPFSDTKSSFTRQSVSMVNALKRKVEKYEGRSV